jgi:hypothetical protein
MATAVLSRRVDAHGYGLHVPSGWHTGNVWRGFTEECARIPNVGAEQMPGFLAQPGGPGSPRRSSLAIAAARGKGPVINY